MFSEQFARHLIQGGAKARYRDLLAAFKVLDGLDVLGGVEPIERPRVENHHDLERQSAQNRASALAKDLAEMKAAADQSLDARQHAGLNKQHIQAFFAIETFLLGKAIK